MDVGDVRDSLTHSHTHRLAGWLAAEGREQDKIQNQASTVSGSIPPTHPLSPASVSGWVGGRTCVFIYLPPIHR